MLSLFILTLCFFIPPAQGADTPIDKQAFLKNLIAQIPAHPEHGLLADAPVEKTTLFLHPCSNELTYVIDSLAFTVAQDNHRTLSPALIDDLIIHIQNKTLTKDLARKRLVQCAMCVAEHVKDYIQNNPALEPVINTFMTDVKEFNELNQHALELCKNGITRTNEFLYALNNPNARSDKIVDRFFQDLGDLDWLKEEDDYFAYAEKKLQSIKDLLPLLARVDPAVSTDIAYFFGIINAVRNVTNKKRLRNDEPQPSFHIDQDLAKFILLMRYHSPEMRTHACAVDLIRWRYDLFHGIEGPEIAAAEETPLPDYLL